MAALNLEQYGITDVKEIVYNPSYEFLYEEEMKEYRKKQETNLLFHDAMPDYHPHGSLNFDEYWHDTPHIENFSWLDD